MRKITLVTLLAFASIQAPFAMDVCSLHYEAKSWKDEIAPSHEEIRESYHKAYVYRSLVAKEKKLTKSGTPEDLRQLPYVRDRMSALDAELTVINDRFARRLYKIYGDQGIAVRLEKTDEGHLNLILDYEKTPDPGSLTGIFKFVQEKYGLKQTSISLKDNAVVSALGFYSSYYKRMELGPQQGLKLLDNYLTNTGKHESRHAMFQFYRDEGIESVYHVTFKASEKKLLNKRRSYDKFMTVEELYTQSTDLLTIAREVKLGAENKAVLRKLRGKIDSLKNVCRNTLGMANELHRSMDHFLTHPEDFQNLLPLKLKNDTYAITLYDQYRRTATVHFVSDSQKLFFLPFYDQSRVYFDAFNDHVSKTLTDRNLLDILDRYPSKLTPEDKLITVPIENDYAKTSEGQTILADLAVTALPVLEATNKRFETLTALASLQTQDATKLLKLVDEFSNPSTGGTAGQLSEIRKLVTKMDRRVKERYKDFGSP